MTVQVFRDFSHARPFVPFAVHPADGRAFAVRHPDAASPSRSGRTVSILNDLKTTEVVDMLPVVSLRPLTEAETRGRANPR